MARLLLFAPCERAIVGQEDKAVSLIGVMTGFTANLPFPHDHPVPENATAPIRWYLVSVWKCDASEVGSEFYQRVILNSPSGTSLLSVDLRIAPQQEQLIVRGIVHLSSFPIKEFGTHVAILQSRRRQDDEWEERSHYPIDVTRGPVLDLKQPISPI